jgi:hypothetical protein
MVSDKKEAHAMKPLKLAILGAGGLGKGMVKRAQLSPDFKTVAIVDSEAYYFSLNGIHPSEVENLSSLGSLDHSVRTPQAIMDLLEAHGQDIDVIFMALPNIPVAFMPEITQKIALQGSFQGVIVDALKRTRAVEMMLELDSILKQAGLLYITGAGATPGFLSTLAAVAAQSFVEVKQVEIKFGVGIANWNQYKATVREDFLHLEGFDADRVAQMTDADIEAELEKRNGLIELVNMEHADDLILELAGICPRENVIVGGWVDTRHAKKPISTTVLITGITTQGETATHTITLDDASTMVDNVCGPALGFLRQGVRLQKTHHWSGILTSADIMPRGGVEARVTSPTEPLLV